MRALRLLLIYTGFVVVLSQTFPLTNYQLVLPADIFVYPRSTTSGAQNLALSLIFTWLVPAAVAGLLMQAGRSLNWPAVNAKVLVLASCIYVGTWALRWAALFAGAVIALIEFGNKSVRRADA